MLYVHLGKKTSEVKSKDVVITTYQTLCMDFGLPKDIEDGMEEEWIAKHGWVFATIHLLCLLRFSMMVGGPLLAPSSTASLPTRRNTFGTGEYFSRQQEIIGYLNVSPLALLVHLLQWH